MGYVGFRASTQPTEIKCLPTQRAKGRNPTNHAARFPFNHSIFDWLVQVK